MSWARIADVSARPLRRAGCSIRTRARRPPDPITMADTSAILAQLIFGLVHGVLLGCVFPLIAHRLNLILGLANAANVLFKPIFVGIPFDAGSVELGFLRIPLGGVYVAVLSVGIIYATHVFLGRTYLGNAIRAYSQDIPATQLMGINPTAVAAIGTGLAFGVTMAGGAFLTVLFPTGINPYMGALYAPISYVIVVLGGPGKMWGSLVGGLTLGIILDVGQIFLGAPIAYAVAFLTVIPVLLFRPEGILR